GYAGGTTDRPSYFDLHLRNTGHAEVVQVVYDPTLITYATLLDVFFGTHDPTSLNRQGNDVGPEYRSVIFVVDSDQQHTAGKPGERACDMPPAEPFARQQTGKDDDQQRP
ncbi:MAG: peptide-methionine (S)-S-oxide reductase, partial [Rhodospirillales bacterium]|nr:peptide-methionine (S)-S-oxide reductase [Rhodospirillales bacterium]